MAIFIGDFDTSSLVYCEQTFTDSTGLPTALTSGSAACMKLSAGTLAPAGVGAITTSGGLARLTITTASSTSFFAAAEDYLVFVANGTVSGVSVIGYPFARFSIRARTGLYPATAGRTILVDANGRVDLSAWLGVAPNALISGRVDANAAAVTTSADVKLWLASAPNSLISGRVDANAAAVTVSGDVLKWNGTAVSAPATAGIPEVNVKNINNVSTSAVTTVKAVQGLTTADTIVTVSGNVNGNVAGSVGSVTGAVGSVTGNVGGNVVGSVGSVTGAVGSVTGNVGGNVVGSVASVTGAVGSVTAGVTLTAGERNSTADAFLLRDIATGGSATDRNVQNTLRAIRNKTSITTTGQLIVCQEDDVTTAWTAVTTTTTAVSISSVDPV